MPLPLESLYEPIRADLDAATGLLAGELRRCDPTLRELADHAARYGGKRLRPALLLLCGRACGEVTDRHIQAAAVVELIHTATLVHDDVVDAAERRRSGATVNASWGDDVSILLGDLLFARALEAFARFAQPAENQLLARAICEVCEGELLQLMARRQGDLPQDRYFDIIAKKTGALTSVSCALGGALAGQTDGAVDHLGAFGRQLGIAFQIADDCLDIRGDERATGKTLGLDLRGGKLTLPILHLRRHGSDSERRELDALLSDPEADSLRPRFAELLTRSGAFAYCTAAAHGCLRDGAAHLDFLGDRPERAALAALADFAVDRDR